MLERSQQEEEAIAIYRDLLKTNPKNSRAYIQLKALFQKLRRYDDLEKLIQDRLKVYPNDVQSQAELGKVYLLMGNKTAAIEHWKKTLEKNQMSQTAYRVVLQEYIRHGIEEQIDTLVAGGRKKFGKPELFSLELAAYYSRKHDFTKATSEYITYLHYNPGMLKTISRQLLRMSDETESHQAIEAECKRRLEVEGTPLKLLYADFLFKIGQYAAAVQQHRDAGISSLSDLERWLTLANNLMKEKKLNLSAEAFATILRSLPINNLPQFSPRQRKIMGEALYGLALTSEQQIAPVDKVQSLADYFPDNQFFADPYVSGKTIDVSSLQETFMLYDSILVILPTTTFSPQAHFRIGEIKFRITRDFDGALTSFQAASDLATDRTLQLSAITHLADVYLAKGNPSAALDVLENKISSVPERWKEELEVKRCHVLLLSGEVDSAQDCLTLLLEKLGVTDDIFNDVMELKEFVEENYTQANKKEREAFREYLKAEWLLRQAKKIEAQAAFQQVAENYQETPIADNALFRVAEIDQQRGLNDQAITTFSQLSNSSWGDKAATRIAEIYQWQLGDHENALQWYLTVLNEYQESLLVEPVRYRIRELTKESTLN